MTDQASIVGMGLAGWSLLGVAGVAALVLVLIAVTHGVTVPLIVAVVAAVIFAPLAESLPRPAGLTSERLLIVSR